MRIQLIKELSKSIKMAMMAALMFYIMGPLYAKSLDKNKPLAEQLNKEYEIYEIKHNFDLHGDTMIIPKGCTLVFFFFFILCNGTIKGESVTIKPRKKCLSNVNIESGIKSNKRVVYSSFYRDWDGNSLASLCSMCPDKGKVFLDARIDYTQERTIIPDAQIGIDGND